VVACAQQAAVCERPCGRAAPVLEQADQPAAAADKDALPFLDLTPQLDDDIVSGTLAPGMRISPAETARRLGVSPMPVRDALALLEREGLVETAPRRWTRVVELSPELLEELVPLVSLLVQYAVSTAPAVSNDALDRLRRANAAFAAAIEDNDVKAAIDADTRFHDTLVELAANRSLERALVDVRTRFGGDAQWGSLLTSDYLAFGGGGSTVDLINNFRQILDRNPCRLHPG
jgi:DNA-binding FadR family transcriptional regulator